ncbi:MAG: hypothetical protein ACKVQK_01035 [Burkholderiales bacterium]
MAMILMLTFAALIGSYFIASGLQRTQSEVAVEQERRSLASLQEAKAALIAYVAGKAGGPDDSSNPQNDQPGALPCPASDETGVAATSCATALTRIGRFPWKTIGSSDLRDGSGSLLWYALSDNFRKASGTTVINGDTEGTLTVSGISPASKIIAIIIAPGEALATQDRSNNSYANWLDTAAVSGVSISNAGDINVNEPTDTFVTAASSETFNDKIMVVTQADLMTVLEPAVAARIQRDIKPYIDQYFYVDSSNLGWSAFPFPTPFANPDPGTSGTATTRAQSSYLGSTTQIAGLLPLSASVSYPWNAASASVSKTGGLGANTLESVSCTATAAQLGCALTVRALNSVASCGAATPFCMLNPQISVSATVGTNAGVSFASLPTAASVDVRASSSTGSATRTMTGETISGSITSTGLGTVTYQGTHSYSRYRTATFTRTLYVAIPVVVTSSLINSGDTTAGWFIKNEWFRQTFYAVSPGYLPGGGESCVAGSTCLTINNLSSASVASATDPRGTTLTGSNLLASASTLKNQRAILIFAGRALTGSSRPSSALSDYLEDENQTLTDRIFSHKYKSSSGAATTVNSNDHIVVISP